MNFIPLRPTDTSPKAGEEYEKKKFFILSPCVRGTRGRASEGVKNENKNYKY